MSENASPLPYVVTLVVVVHDGARLLPGLASAVREQSYPVQRAVGVDTGSQDRSGAALAEVFGQDAVFGMDADTGYGEAVARALRHPAARTAMPGSIPPPDLAAEWIWLLHDDCEPAPDALEQLLRAASRSSSVAVLGPKVMDAADRRVLREAGLTVDRAGRRVTGIEPGEIDQGQHDGSRPVLAVSSAGMLIRRDVWDQLGGFDPALPLMRDDIDFCWRVHAAGYDVRVITEAVVYHRELSARHIRKVTAAGGHPRLLDRRGALYTFAANLPIVPMLAVLTGCVAGSLLRAACFLLTKQQHRAWDHLSAVGWLLRHPSTLAHARRRRAEGRRHGWAVLHGQLPRGRGPARLAESAAGLLSGGPAYESRGAHQALSDDASDELPLPPADPVLRRVLTSPGVLLFTALAIIALVAERSLTGSVLSGSGTLAGGTLAPAWGGASDLWREYLAGYHATGAGSAASTPPYIAVLAALSTVLGGKPWLAVDVLLLGCVPAAGLTAFLATRRITSVLRARIWLAATYALLPVAMGAVAAGRIGTVVAFVLLPLIGIAVGRILAGRAAAGRPAATWSRFTPRRAAWAAGLLIAVAAAFVPLVWLIAVAAALAAVAAWPWLGRATAVNAVIAAAVPAVLLVPWTFHLFASPSALFLEAGLQRPGLTAAGLGPGSVLLLSPGGPGLPPAWVTVGLVLPAFCALLARRRLALVYTGWAIALAGLVIALVVSRVRVTGPGGAAVSAWPGIATAFAAIGLLLAAAPLIEAAALAPGPLRRRLHGRRPAAAEPADGRRPALAVWGGLAVAVSAPVLAAVYWLGAGLSGPVSAASPQILPPFVAAASAGPDQPRTLVLRQDGAALSYTVLRSTDPILGEPELTQDAAATRQLNGVVAALAAAASGDGGDAGAALRQFDIGYILLPAPVDQALAGELDGAAGLVRVTTGTSYDLWQVAGTVAQARVISPDGTIAAVPSAALGVNTTVAAGPSGTLVLAEAAGGWSATLNGKPLARVVQPVDGWAQGFVLPAGGGHLVITRDDTARDLSLAAELVAVFVVIALSLPGTRAAAAAAAAAEDEPESATGPERRRDRAGGPKPARRKRPGFALASLRPGGTPGAEAEATEAGRGPGSAAGAEPWPEPDLPPAHQTRAEPDPGYAASTAAAEQPAAARLQPVAAKRPRGGQHAARHGKPARRSRGPALENLDLVPADEDAGPSTRVSHEETGDWS